MKLFKKLMIAVLSVALLFSTYSAIKIEPKAATGTTYYIKYVAGKFWANFYDFQWGDMYEPFDPSILNYKMVDGDSVVIYLSGQKFEYEFLHNVGELFIADSGFAVITAPSYEKVHITAGSTAAVNGYVADGYVYDNAVANFNNDVNTLHLVQVNEKKQTVNVLGTVGCAEESKFGEVFTNNYYNFKKGACVYKEGGMRAEAGTYSRDPGAYAPTLPVLPTLPGVPGTGGNDLDDVPKTGELNLKLSIILLSLSALSTAGAYILYRKKA